MAERPDRETIEIIDELISTIREKFKPEKIILFGSRARGDNLKSSDIDLIIVSDYFEGMEWRRRIIEVFGIWDKPQMFEPLCYTPEEFERKKEEYGIVKVAVEEGIVL